MKISLNTLHTEPQGRESHLRTLERDILAAQTGDWNAKANLAKTFKPLLLSLAEKRSGDRDRQNYFMEAGKQGLYLAAKKYKRSVGVAHFQVFALNFIEKGMNQAAAAGGGGIGGFFRRLFGR